MTKDNATFKGFPPEAVTFLAGLSRNNNKDWFEAHRGAYDEAIVAPALAFVEAMGAALKRGAPSVKPEPRVGGSLFRIHRDTRFSADKRPYKTHVGIPLRDGDTATSSKCTGPPFYIEFDAKNLRLGVGVKEFDQLTLAAYRLVVAGRKGAQEIGNIVSQAEAEGHDILGDTLARVPHAYANQSDNELLRRKGLFIRQETPLPNEIHGPEFVGYCGRWLGLYVPLFRALRKIAIQGLGS